MQNLRNVKVDVDSNEISIPNGYYDFSQLKIFLEKNSIIIEKNADSTIKVTARKAVNLSNLGPILGFSTNKSIAKDATEISDSFGNFTNFLDEIYVHCPFVDSDSNYDLKGNNSYLLMIIPIDTTQPLTGTFSYYRKSDVSSPAKNFTGQEMTFYVDSGGDPDDYSIVLTLLIE